MKKILLALLFTSHFSLAQNSLVKQWDYRFGGTDDDWLYSLQQTTDGGYILGGYSISDSSGDKTQPSWGGWDHWIVKTDSLGIKQWDKRFGGTGYDKLSSLQQTTDGGYILGGSSYSGISGDKTQPSWGGWDYWIVKIDSLGIKQWDKRFGGTDADCLFSLQQTTDGGYILGGYSYSGIGGDKTQPSWGGWDYWILKIDSLGVKQWDARFGGNSHEFFSSLKQTTDGGYVLGGSSESGIGGDKTQPSWGHDDYWILKIDSLGVKQWDKRFGGIGDDNLCSVQQTTDGGYILGGSSSSGISGDKSEPSWGGDDYWIVKIDSLGVKQWDKRLGGTDDEQGFGNITQTSDGGYLIAGTSYSPFGGDKTENNLGVEQSWIVKTDSNGTKEWDKTVLTTGHDELGQAIQTKDGCFVIANWTLAGIGGDKTQASQGNYDYWIVKFCDMTSIISFVTYDNNLCEKFCTNFQDQSMNINATSWQWQFPGGNPSSSTEQNPANICYNVPGVYDVTLITTNAFGNDTLTLVNYITVYPTPPIPTITQAGYTLISSPANSYQWQHNSINISGATNQSYTILQSGYYTVIVADSNGCVNSFTEYVLISGIDGVMNDGNISIYPNPSSGNFMVEWLNGPDLIGMIGQVSIEVVNTLGQIIFSSTESRSIVTISGFQKEIELSNAASGIYFIEIKTANVFARKKILITE
ncbi:MAG TPA: T9SS type A sorting domain-containing protein [Chitinophagales bacterium]|nr:T9SS type A sorting domain-containing protein [Chitinophagales bacterium]